jgi:scyllo-inositol 2-dehydrogenase (NADP+)
MEPRAAGKNDNADRSTIDVGLIGFGLAGRVFHAPLVSAVPGLRLAAIVQRHTVSAAEQDPEAFYPDARIVRSVDELLADDRIRLVIIATPNSTHAELAQHCLESGRDVVVDKPFTTSSTEARGLIRLAESQRRLLTVFHNRRWDGDFITVRQLLGSGAIGRTVGLESHFDRFRPNLRPDAWREKNEPGSGALFDLGSHLLDQALLLFGAPHGVLADVRIERDGAVVDDAFDVCLEYANLRVWLRSSMLAAENNHRFLIRGTHGAYVKYGFDPQEQELRKGAVAYSPTWGVEPQSAWGNVIRQHEHGCTSETVPTAAGDYRLFYENVRDAILGRAALEVTAEQAYDTIRAIELARESSHRGCAMSWQQ